MSDGVPARQAALAILEAILERDRTFDEAAAESELLATLEPRDRGFVRLTVMTVLRRLGQLDALIAQYMQRPPVGRAKRVIGVLRIGLAHLLILKTPPHAAVDAAVALARAERLDAMAGVVNAVLRRAGREGADHLAAQDAERLNTPDWLWQDWVTQYGEETCRAIAVAHIHEPPLDLTVRDDIAGWAERLGARMVGASTLRLEQAGDVTALPGYDTGDWWVQDAAAALPARLFPALMGKRVVDLCAAPGGKTAQLIAAGADVTAVDRSNPRLRRLRDNLTRLNMTADCIAADAAVWRPDSPVDAVLLDAPCSATGTLRRHPEIAHRRGVEDVRKLAALQRRLVDAAAEMLVPGGILVIATCSLQSAEGAALFAHAKDIPGLALSAIDRSELPECPDAVMPDGSLRTHPGMMPESGGMDGFFAARFVRR